MPILSPSKESIELAAQTLQKGGLVAMPTETVYGLAASIYSEDAVRQIFEVKGRPLIDPLIVHVASLEQVEQIAQKHPLLEVLAKTFWPGPLTLILQKKPCISDLITAGKDTVAVRMPKKELFRDVLKKLNHPVAAPSANPFGYLSPTQAAHVQKMLGKKVEVILDGGECEIGLESTILDLTTERPTILRPGPITADNLKKILGKEVGQKQITADKQTSLSAPGLLTQHYSPNTPLKLFEATPPPSENNLIAAVFLKRPQETSPNTFWLSESGDLNEVAHNLFALLQQLDTRNFSTIYFQMPPQQGIGIAINDRLSRAAAKFK